SPDAAPVSTDRPCSDLVTGQSIASGKLYAPLITAVRGAGSYDMQYQRQAAGRKQAGAGAGKAGLSSRAPLSARPLSAHVL
ncbi:hypothetical protein V494_01401, partial [Pseudogymnoascus sp. VKM F-4513 (FW-928)]